MFQERGDQSTSLRRIAESIGVSHATLLHFFDSGEQLLLAVYEHAESQRETAGAKGPVAVIVDAATRNVRVCPARSTWSRPSSKGGRVYGQEGSLGWVHGTAGGGARHAMKSGG
ncbi:TetR/AcrR family transcriptional regulator [Brachybacterium endophyticum]|uniref:TetR/AcrR family transcriptional regulator n=1 Tax=Brachybacterium endophyticum TaxID=2182385 RepID=UPI003B8317B9